VGEPGEHGPDDWDDFRRAYPQGATIALTITQGSPQNFGYHPGGVSSITDTRGNTYALINSFVQDAGANEGINMRV